MDFKRELKDLINKCSLEKGSDTPDFILVEYLWNCLLAFECAVEKREEWYGRRVLVKDERGPVREGESFPPFNLG